MNSRKKIHVVYYLLDDSSSVLLYVGRSFEPARRKREFENRLRIKTQIILTTEMFLKAAQELERLEIAELLPPFNRRIASSPSMLDRKHSNATLEYLKEFRNRPVWREKLKTYWTKERLKSVSGSNNPMCSEKARKNASNNMTARWADPEDAARMLAGVRAYWSVPANRRKRRAQIQKYFADKRKQNER